MILLESDLIFEDGILQDLITSPAKECAVVAPYEDWMDGTTVRINRQNDITLFVPKQEFERASAQPSYKTVNIYKFSREFLSSTYLPALESYISDRGCNDYYEDVLRLLVSDGRVRIKAVNTVGRKWYEIDNKMDLYNAETVFI